MTVKESIREHETGLVNVGRTMLAQPARSAVQWYMPGRKRPFAGTTKATSDLVELIAEDNPSVTVSSSIGLIRFDSEAQDILRAYSEAGYADVNLTQLLTNQVAPVRPRPRVHSGKRAPLSRPSAHASATELSRQ